MRFRVNCDQKGQVVMTDRAREGQAPGIYGPGFADIGWG